MEQKVSVGNRLRELRKEKGVSQDDLARLLNINKTTVSNYESDRRNLSVENITTLCKYFNVTADYLLGITDKRIITDKTQIVDVSESIQDLGISLEQLLNNKEFLMRLVLEDSTYEDANKCLETITSCGNNLKEILDMATDFRNGKFTK